MDLQNVQECDATDDDSSDEAGGKKVYIILSKGSLYFCHPFLMPATFEGSAQECFHHFVGGLLGYVA